MAVAEVIEKKEDIEIGADWECPICAKNPPFNAKLMASIEECRAVSEGKIPGKIYHGSEIYKAIEEALADTDI